MVKTTHRRTVVGQMVPRIMVNGEVTVRNGLQQCNLGELHMQSMKAING